MLVQILAAQHWVSKLICLNLNLIIICIHLEHYQPKMAFSLPFPTL